MLLLDVKVRKLRSEEEASHCCVKRKPMSHHGEEGGKDHVEETWLLEDHATIIEKGSLHCF